MKKIILKELTLTNWKGQNRTVKFGDKENKISGKNASGKTSLMKAWYWLITGYCDHNSPMNSDLFDNTKEITKDTPIASVKAVISIDGEINTIERTAEAKFIRKRGTDVYEKASSDSYVYKVNDIERSASDFQEWLSSNFCQADVIRFVLGGDFFIKQIFDDKKKARQIIEKVVGEVNANEMKGDYSEIADLLEKYSLSEIEERATNLSKGIKHRLDEIPSLINNMSNEIAEIEQNDFVAIEKEIKRLEDNRESCEKRQIDLTERLRPQMEKRSLAIETRQMRQDVFEQAYKKWCNEPQEEIARITGEINAIIRQNNESKRKYEDAVQLRERKIQERDNALRELKLAEERVKHCITERDDELARTMTQNDSVCKFCGAELTGEKLQEAIDKFEFVKRENLLKIVAKGKSERAEIERLTKIADDAKPFIDAEIPAIICQSTEDLEKNIAKLSGRSTSKDVFANTELGKKLQNDIDSVVIPEITMPEDGEIKAEKDKINSELIPLYEKRGLKNRAEKLQNSIDDLRSEQKDKGAELAKYERQRQLVNDYKQEQMQILSNKVNDGLKFSRIEVWSQQKDGTVVPDIVLKDAQGVSYATTNNASRITTAIDVQRFFCEKLCINMPCFVDESSVLDSSNTPKMDDAQVFYLFCSETSLTVESV